MGLSIKDTLKYGRGIFATKDYKKGELIESCPIIIVYKRERRYLVKTQLVNYFFNWGDNNIECAIALGYGSLYNHSYSPNAKFENNYDDFTIDFYAIEDIQAGEEIKVNYNGDPTDQSKLWFNVHE